MKDQHDTAADSLADALGVFQNSWNAEAPEGLADKLLMASSGHFRS